MGRRGVDGLLVSLGQKLEVTEKKNVICSTRIIAKVVGLESLTQSIGTRRQHGFLSHLPTKSTFQLCTIELCGLVPPEEVALFEKEYDQRNHSAKKENDNRRLYVEVVRDGGRDLERVRPISDGRRNFVNLTFSANGKTLITRGVGLDASPMEGRR